MTEGDAGRATAGEDAVPVAPMDVAPELFPAERRPATDAATGDDA